MCLSIAVQHPELVLGEGLHLGYEWNIVSGPLGHRCGYIRVPKGHPWHGKEYDDIEANVHGGLTFAEKDTPCGKGGKDDGYWVGFDCAHCGDAPDRELYARFSPEKQAGFKMMAQIHADIEARHPLSPRFRDKVRSQEYVIRECQQLIEQAVKVA